MFDSLDDVGAPFEVVMAHYGVKGMHWGVRKDQGPSPSVGAEGVTVRADGSISVKAGASLQRLVRSNGKSLPMKDLTYASMTSYDNAKYIKVIGGKGFLGGGRDQILGLTATSKIEAPSKDAATRMVSNLMLNNSEFRNANTSILGGPIGEKGLEKIRKDPGGKEAQAWYDNANTKLTFNKDFDPNAPKVQQLLRAEVEKNGFNALRDENDVRGGVAKAPLIIFSPEKVLKVTTVTDITDQLRKANKEQLKTYKSRGQKWVEHELYSS